MKEKMDNTGTALATLSSLSVVIPSIVHVHSPYPDYSAYFEPTTDTTRRFPANTENVAGSIPDFSDYFEPVAGSVQPLRVRLS